MAIKLAQVAQRRRIGRIKLVGRLVEPLGFRVVGSIFGLQAGAHGFRYLSHHCGIKIDAVRNLGEISDTQLFELLSSVFGAAREEALLIVDSAKLLDGSLAV